MGGNVEGMAHRRVPERPWTSHPFHGKLDGETTPAMADRFTGNPTVKQEGSEDQAPLQSSPNPDWTLLDVGILLGLLIGEGHFGGDGRQPQITLRMHADHEALFLWLVKTFPGGKLYGPYHHGGRHYFQWMVRGAYLKDTLVPLLDRHFDPALDAKTWLRYQEMKRRYRLG